MAVVRFYLTSDAAGFTPATARGAWDLTNAAAFHLGTAPAGAATTAELTESTATGDQDLLLARWVSDPITAAGSISNTGTAPLVVGRQESAAGMNAVGHTHLWVTQGDTDTVRGTLVVDRIGSTEWPTTANALLHSTSIDNTVACQVGDRIVLEFGCRAANTSATAFTATIHHGNTGGTDLANGDTAVTTKPAWLELDVSDLFVAGTIHTETGSAATGAAGSGSKTVTSAAVHTDTGAGASRGAGSGAKVVTPATVHSDTGSGATRTAGSGAKTVTAATVRTVTGAGASRGAGSGARDVIVVVVHDKAGSAAVRMAGSGAVEVTAPQVHDKAGSGATRVAGIGTPGSLWAVPVYVDRPRARTLQLAPPVRFIAQHARTGEFLHWNLPVTDAVIELRLSGPTVISGKFTPEIRTLLDEQGRPLLRGWGTWVHCEIDGVIRASGIVQPAGFTGPEWTLDCEGFTGYAHDMPYEASYSVVGIDGIDVVQEIWRYIQSFPDAVQGVTVPRTATIPTKLGEPARTETAEDGTVTQIPAKPYELMPWDAKDCGTEIDTLAKAAPFDYVERCAWNADHSDVVKTLDIGYPRIGRRNTDAVFIQGPNVAVVPSLVEAPDLYASAVLGIGAGQGAKAVREAVEQPDPDRLRRVHVYQNQKITDPTEMRRLITEERARRGNAQEFTQIVIHAKHPNARFGSYGIGDDVLVQGEIPWVGSVRLWHRVVGISYQPYTQYAVLSLKRSDRFRYGKAAA